MNLEQFTDYCMGFYGPQGLYPMGMTPDEIQKAVRLMDLFGNFDLEGDSVDRERVRDIVRIMRGEKLTTHWEI
jgi:hypothetical protein